MHDAWKRACELEREDRIEEAETVLEAAIDQLAALSQIAHLHELRMQRLLAAGEREGARVAFDRSCWWMAHRQSLATSGGEAAALGEEARAHRARLLADLGGIE